MTSCPKRSRPVQITPPSREECRQALENTSMCRHPNPIPQPPVHSCAPVGLDCSALLSELQKQTLLLQELLCALTALTAAQLSRPLGE